MIEQAHRVANKIRNALESREYCPAIFLDVKQAFDKVWIPGLLHKISEYLPLPCIKLLQSYLTNRTFEVHFGEARSPVQTIGAGVPQGSVLGPLLYVLYTADIPTRNTTSSEILMFADDLMIFSANKDPGISESIIKETTNKLQRRFLKNGL
ncbi:hypothetical protein PGB90_003287 [Kerria lacca]